MKITAHLFEAFLKCATKCHLRSLGETGSGNEYAEGVHTQDELCRREAVRRLQEGMPETGRVVAPPVTENLTTAKWRAVTDVAVRIEFRSSRGNEAQTSSPQAPMRDSQPNDQSLLTSAATIVESCLHAVERVASESRGTATQFVPIRFILLRNALKFLLSKETTLEGLLRMSGWKRKWQTSPPSGSPADVIADTGSQP